MTRYHGDASGHFLAAKYLAADAQTVTRPADVRSRNLSRFKPMRRLLLLSLPILLVILAVAVGYGYLISRDKGLVRGELEAALEQALGRPVSIGGELDFRLRPLPAVSARGLRVGNAPWAHASELLSVERIDLVPSLIALLRRRIVIRRLELDGVRLWLENSTTGEPNWRLPPAPADAEASPIRVAAIVAEDVELSYFNVDRGITRRVRVDRLEATAAQRTGPLELEFTGDIEGLELAGVARLDSPAKLSDSERAEFSADLRLGESRLRLSGDVTDPDFRDYTGFQVAFELAGRRAALLLDWTDLPIPEMRRFALRGRLEGDGGRLALRGLEGDMAGEGYDVRVAGEAEDLVTMGGIDLRLDAVGTNPVGLVPALELPRPRLGRFSASGRIVGTRPAFALEDVKGELEQDNVELAFEGRVGDLREGRHLELASEISGRRLGLLADVWGLAVPDLDEVELRGVVVGEWSAPTIEALTGTVRKGGITARFAGEVADLSHLSGIALSFEGAGSDLADLDATFGLALPNTESLSAAGRLSGNLQALDLHFERASLTRGDLRLEGTGTIADLAEAPRVDLDLTLSGADVRQGGELIGVELFATDRFRVRGRLQGPLSAPDLEAVTGQFVNPQAILDVQGRVPDVFGGHRLDLRPIFRGRDLAGLGALIGQRWPETDSYTLSGHVHGTWANPTLDEIDVQLSHRAGTLLARGRIGDLLAGRDVALSVDARVASVTAFLPFGGRLWDRLGAVTGNFDISGGPDDYVMAIDELAAGSSRLSGRFNLGFDSGSLTHVHGRLENSVLDITPWLEFAESDAGPDIDPARPSAADERLFSTTPVPIGWMQDLDMDVELAGNQVAIGRGVIDVATGELVVRDQRMRIDPFDVDYSGSEISGGFRLTGSPAPGAELRAKAIGFDLGSLLRRSGLAPEASGRVDLQVDLRAEGDSPRAMATSADGRIALLMVEGSLGQADIQLRLTQVMAGLVRREPRDITVDCGMLDLPVSDGVGRLSVFVLDTPDMLMRGRGTVDFGREQLDILLLPRPKRGRVLAHNANVRIHGPMLDPRQSIDASDTATTVASAIGRFALLGPAGLFVNRSTFERAHQECASTLAEVMRDR